MKYTVVIAQSVSPERRPELAERLSTKFGLPPEQAHKLAARKAGRLLKPTTRARAEALLALYAGMNLPAAIEAVPDEGEHAEGEQEAVRVAEPALVGAAGSVRHEAGTFAPSPTVIAPSPRPSVRSEEPTVAPAQPAPAQPAPAQPVLAEASVPAPVAAAPRAAADEAREEASPAPARRFSLHQRVLLTTVLPLVLTGVVTTVATATLTQQIQQRITRNGASALAASLGTSLNVEDPTGVDTQLRTLLKQPQVGFISVKLPDDSRFFQTKNEIMDYLLGKKVDAWLTQHPGASSFVDRDRPADRLEAQLKQLKDSGAAVPSLVDVLQKNIDKPENQRVTTNHYELQNLGIYSEDGQRVAREVGLSGKQKPLFTVAVGVLTNDSVADLRSSLLTIVLLALALTGVAALFAIRLARRIVQPIENLVKAADAISLGQLDTPVQAERNDEIGDLARALERMRLSLEAAMERLRKRRSRES